MARLIQVQNAQECPSKLRIAKNDVLLFRASGGHIQSGGEAIELMGIFMSAVLCNDGNVFTPDGPPNTVIFRAKSYGQARIDIITGDPFYKSQILELEITINSMNS